MNMREGIPHTKKHTEEFEFHQNRFKKKYQNKTGLNDMYDGNLEQSQIIAASYDEASRELADRKKRESLEFRKWQENLHPVVEHFLEKVKHPEKKDIRTLVLALGGGVRGQYGTGQFLALSEMGISPDTIVGISVGAITGAYASGGLESLREGTEMFHRNEIMNGFIMNNVRDIIKLRKMMNIDFVADEMRHGKNKIDTDSVKHSESAVYLGVTNKDTKKLEFINAQEDEMDIVNALKASIAVPLLYGQSVKVNGKNYIDGAFDPASIRDIITQFNPTDILVLPQTPFDHLDNFKLSPGEKLSAWISSKFGSVGSMGTVEKFIRTKQGLRKLFEDIQKEKEVNIGVLWPPDGNLSAIDKDIDKMKTAVLDSFRDTYNQFGLDQPDTVQLYNNMGLNGESPIKHI